MNLDASISLFPFLHGKALFAKELRSRCLEQQFDCIAIDLPELFEPHISDAIDLLPEINALVVQESVEPLYYLPIDPCDATIEAVRQSYQLHIPLHIIGFPTCERPAPLPPMPDEYAIMSMGLEPFCTLCLLSISHYTPDPVDELHSRYLAYRLSVLKKKYTSILAVIHLRHISQLHHFFHRSTFNHQFPHPATCSIISQRINPDHLYFALGELPYVTGNYERERYDVSAPPYDPLAAIKDLFRETRESMSATSATIPLSPVRIQAALVFLRNLTILSHRLQPSLFDIVEAAKGVGGNSYALQILKNAKYYPWFSLENTTDLLGIGINKIRVPDWGITAPAINLFRDHQLYWRSLVLHPDPSETRKKKYRYRWNPFGMCSHIPEDTMIENFNGRVRNKTLRLLIEDHVSTDKFSTSIKDGIDIRETLRHWHSGDIYVKELPPARGKIDTVVIIFDNAHDAQYTHCTTWYAEHPEESTLSFYATNPFDQLIGPGIARCQYGGLSLLFPPRSIPDIFQLPAAKALPNLCTRLTFGALLFSSEKVVAFIAREKPDSELVKLARSFGKRLLWIPISTFSHETIVRLRTFHILNGKNVRSWAARFIED